MDLSNAGQVSKGSAAPNQVLDTASEAQCIHAIKDILLDEFSTPSRESVDYFANRLFPAIKTKPTPDQFSPVVKAAFRQFVDDQVNARLQMAEKGEADQALESIHKATGIESRPFSHDMCVTDEEFEKFFIVDVT